MDSIAREILFALSRAAVADLLSREPYTLTVPTLILFSILTYAAIVRDPLRSSLPPYIGLQSGLAVLNGKRRPREEARAIVRLSVFGRDAFWVSRNELMDEILASEAVVPVLHGKGFTTIYGDREKTVLRRVFTSSNILKFYEIMDEEINQFIRKVSKAQVISFGLIHEFASRLLERMAYGSGPKETFKHVSLHRQVIRSVLLHHFFPFTDRLFPLKDPGISVLQTRPVALSLDSQFAKHGVNHATVLSQFIVENASSVITGALHQVFLGLLSKYTVARLAQAELDKLLPGKDNLVLEDVRGLVVLPSITAESLRLSSLVAPVPRLYKVIEDVWYRKSFLPKDSIVILDLDEIFQAPHLSDRDFRPERFFDNHPSPQEVDAVVFPYGFPQEMLVKTVLFNTIATVLRKFNIMRSQSDGKLKYVRLGVKIAEDK